STASSNPLLLAPSCGTFNVGYPGHGQGKYSTPFGVPQLNAAGNQTGSFLFDYTKQFQYSTESEDYDLYNSLSWEATDWLRLNATLNNGYRLTVGRTARTTATSGT